MTLDQRPARPEDAPIELPADPPPWRGRFLLYLVGAGMIVFGLVGILGLPRPLHWAFLVAVAAVAHDVLLVPLLFLVAVPLSRLRTDVRRYLVTGLALTAVLTAVAWPGIGGFGRRPNNPSILPLDYAAGLRISLLVLWAVLLVAFAVQRVVRTRREVPADTADR